MNKKLPYEEALGRQLGNLPLPDEDASWQKMQELLDDRKRRSPFFLQSDNAKSVLILLLLLCFLIVMHSSRHDRTAVASAGTKQTLQANTPAIQPARVAHSRSNQAGREPAASSRPGSAAAVRTSPSLTPVQPTYAAGLNHFSGKTNRSGSKTARAAAPERLVAYHTAGQKQQARNKPGLAAPERRVAGPGREVASMQPGAIRPVMIAESIQNHISAPELFSGPLPGNKARLLPALQAPAEKGIYKKKENGLLKLSANPFFVRAGVGVQQAIPVGGQKQVSFNLNGQKNLLSDYIPSLFLRLEKNRKWYLQAEFSYAAPRLVNDFSYSRQTRTDTAFRTVTTSLLLKKVYYRELPLSFNYYVHANWTVGAGATYSWFHGAITEKETATRNLQNQTSSVAKQIVPIERYTDSFLYRSHSYLLLQTNYQWQSLSLGMRFSKDVQPYIRYTLPDGTVADKRNWSLELLVRLGLWKSARL